MADRSARMAEFTAKINAVDLPGFEGTIARKMSEEIALATSEGRQPFGGEDLAIARARLEEDYSWMKTSGLTPEDRELLEKIASGHPDFVAVLEEIAPIVRELRL